MFEIGDKVFDSYINKIGTIISIMETDTYPIQISFPDFISTYTTSGKYNIQTGSRYIKKNRRHHRYCKDQSNTYLHIFLQ